MVNILVLLSVAFIVVKIARGRIHIMTKCMICVNPEVTALSIMNHFYPHLDEIHGNICDKHKITFHNKMGEFLDQHD